MAFNSERKSVGEEHLANADDAQCSLVFCRKVAKRKNFSFHPAIMANSVCEDGFLTNMCNASAGIGMAFTSR